MPHKDSCMTAPTDRPPPCSAGAGRVKRGMKFRLILEFGAELDNIVLIRPVRLF